MEGFTTVKLGIIGLPNVGKSSQFLNSKINLTFGLNSIFCPD
jgi:tRNA U34 5-carboxymethylaminomethyl modifying GTPase MnmE/TrmE